MKYRFGRLAGLVKDSLMYRFEGSEAPVQTGSEEEHSSYLENLILKNAKRNREIEIEMLNRFPVIIG